MSLRRRIELRYRAERLGRRGACSFCGYIGPPLLCGCVTELRHALKDAHDRLDDVYMERMSADGILPRDAAESHEREVVLARDAERVRILNEALAAER